MDMTPYNNEGNFSQFAYVDEPFLSWDFSLLSADKKLIGSVNRNFAGFGREIFTDTGVYALRMDAAGLAQEPGHLISKTGQQAQPAQEGPNAGMTLDQRAVMLATAVSVDFDYFSRKSSSGGMGGFMPMWFPGGGGGASAEGAGAGAGVEGAGASGGGIVRGEAGEVGQGAAVGAGTMAGYGAMQGNGMNKDQEERRPSDYMPDPTPGIPSGGSRNSQTGQGGQSGQVDQDEDVWGNDDDPWDDDPGGGGGTGEGGGGDVGGGDGGGIDGDALGDLLDL